MRVPVGRCMPVLVDRCMRVLVGQCMRVLADHCMPVLAVHDMQGRVGLHIVDQGALVMQVRAAPALPRRTPARNAPPCAKPAYRNRWW
jgi:hypothetical protein